MPRCNVFVLAASNLPWDLDPAFLRRLEKRVYVPLPDMSSRKKMFMYYLSSSLSSKHHPETQQHRHRISFTEEKYFIKCAELTDGYSGADIKLVCKEAAMRPLRRIFDYLHNHENQRRKARSNNNNDDCHSSQNDVLKCMENNPITIDDVYESISSTKPTTVSSFCQKYNDWNNSFGST